MDFVFLLGKALEGDIIPVEICVHGVVCIRHIVFHTAIISTENKKKVGIKYKEVRHMIMVVQRKLAI